MMRRHPLEAALLDDSASHAIRLLGICANILWPATRHVPAPLRYPMHSRPTTLSTRIPARVHYQ